MMKKFFALFAGIAAALILFGALFFVFFPRNRGTQAWSKITANFPSAELATRTVRWQCVIGEEKDFPASFFVIGRTATIKAGFDLARVEPKKDLSIDDKKRVISLKLPPPEILSVEWSENRVILEKRSAATALLVKSGNEENRRRHLFNEALLVDAKQNDLLDFDALSEGIYRYLAPWAKSFGYRLIVHAPERSFSDALAAYLQKRP